jgi:hypothetical protein
MKIKIKITTPKGQALGTSSKLKPFLIGFNKVKCETYVNDEDDTIYIEVEGEPRRVLKVASNAHGYSAMITNIFEKKIMGKGIKDYIDKPEDKEALEKMLKEGTTVEIIKEEELSQMVELPNEPKKTLWQSVKDKFKRIE